MNAIVDKDRVDRTSIKDQAPSAQETGYRLKARPSLAGVIVLDDLGFRK